MSRWRDTKKSKNTKKTTTEKKVPQFIENQSCSPL